MANKRIKDLPLVTSTDTGDVLAIDGATTRSIAFTDLATSVAVELDLGNVDNTSDADKPVSTAQAAAIAVVQSDVDTHEANTSNPHSVTKTQVGLGNVDNTSDATKNAASVTLTNKTISGASNTLTVRLANDVTGSLPNANLAPMATGTFKGNVSGSTAAPSDLTAAQVTAALPVATTSAKGLAPVLPNDATKYLDGTGAYTVPAGGGGGDTTALRRGHSAKPIFVPIHFTCMKGTAHIAGEPVISRVTSAAAAAGDRTTTFTVAPTWVAGQLVAYLASNGQYYTAAVKSVSGSTVTWKQPLEAAIASGGQADSFWREDIHPTLGPGYYAMADYMYRGSLLRKRLAYKWVAGDSFTGNGTTTATADTSLSFSNPGSTTTGARKFVATSANGGMVTPAATITPGNYVAQITLCANTEAASADTASTSIQLAESGTITGGFVGSSSRCAEMSSFTFAARIGKTYQLYITADAIGTGFSVSQIEFYELTDFIPDHNYGKHVVLGDSFVFEAAGTGNGYIIDRLQARMPNATFINAGVGGNTTAAMPARFAADVAAQSPDVVWIVATGANDYAAGTSVATYESNVARMQSATAAIRADCILVGAAVGPLAHTTLGDLLTASRNYVINTKIGA